MQSSDRDRLRRLKDSQIAARDPQIQQRRLHQTIAEKHRRGVRPFSWRRFWAEIPFRWRGTLFGGFFGVVLAVLAPVFLPAGWAAGMAAIGFVFAVILGFFLGRAVDTRVSLEDLTR